MNEDVSVLVEYFGNNPVIRAADFLLENRLFDYSKKQIAEGSGIGKVTLFKNWKKIEELGLVKASRKFGNTTLYKLNEENPVVRKFIELELVLAEEASKKALIEAKIRA